MGFVAKAISAITGGGSKPAAAPVAPPDASAQDAQAIQDEEARKRLLAINSGAVAGQVTGPGGDLSVASTTKKNFLGL